MSTHERFLWVAVVFPSGKMLRHDDQEMSDEDRTHLWALGCRNNLDTIRNQAGAGSFVVLQGYGRECKVLRLAITREKDPNWIRFKDFDAAIMCAIMKARQ